MKRNKSAVAQFIVVPLGILFALLTNRFVTAAECIAGKDPQHEGCQAGPLDAGTITGPGNLWHAIGHEQEYTLNGCWDIDHCDCQPPDQSETYEGFVITWESHRANPDTGQWETPGVLLGIYDGRRKVIASAHNKPRGIYRILAWVDDTPNTGVATGDDAADYAFINFTVSCPVIVNWRETFWGRWSLDPDTMIVVYEWDSSCQEGGDRAIHLGHLDKVQAREKLIYSPYVQNGQFRPPCPPWLNDGSWDKQSPEYISIGNVTSGFNYDYLGAGGFAKPYVSDQFNVAQYLEQRCTNETGQWGDWWCFKTYSIDRQVFQRNGRWWYMCMKSSHEIDVDISDLSNTCLP